MKNSVIKYYPLMALLLLCGFYVFKAISFPAHDFANYYFGGKFLAEGSFSSDTYFPYEFNKAVLDSGHSGIFVSYAPNTPFLAVFFLLFSVFSLAAAKLIFNCISVGLLIFSLCRLFQHYKIELKYLLLIPILFLVPIKNNLLFGQVYFLLFFLLSEGWLAYEKKQWKSMAFFWSLAILLKVFPALLILFLVFKKQWKSLIYLALGSLLLFGISLFFTGIDIWFFYLKEVLPKASNGEIATAFVDNYQSVFMFLKRIFVYEAVENPNALFNAPIWFSAVMVAFKIGLVSLGYFITRKSNNNLQILSFWILAMILLSPYGSTYTFILLFFPFLALLKSDVSNVKKVVFCTILFIINNLALSLFIEMDFPFSYLRLLFLLLLFSLFLIPFWKEINWKIVTLFSFIPMILVLIFKKNDSVNSSILLKDGPILIYNYKIENNNLTGFFKDEKGERVVLMHFNALTVEPLNLKDNQVFYQKKQLTFDNSKKLKPMLIDGKTILYLSDYDRGIGFYTLRKIEL